MVFKIVPLELDMNCITKFVHRTIEFMKTKLAELYISLCSMIQVIKQSYELHLNDITKFSI